MSDDTDPFKKIHGRLDVIEGLQHKILRNQKSYNPDDRITRKMICEIYKVSLKTIHNAMNSGALPWDKIGAKTIFKRSDVEEWASMSGKKPLNQ